MSNKDDLLIGSINWNNEGLIPVITQDAKNKKVLMLAWMNRDALKESLSTGTVVYWSKIKKTIMEKRRNIWTYSEDP